MSSSINGFLAPSSISGSYVLNKRNQDGSFKYDSLLNKIELDDFCFIRISPHSSIGFPRAFITLPSNSSPTPTSTTLCVLFTISPS